MLLLAKEYGFKSRLCRSYRAKTKGKVERLNRYLKESFIVPWLSRVANERIHGTTNEAANARLLEERQAFLPLPIKNDKATTIRLSSTRQLAPFEGLQHPLSVNAPLEECASAE